MLWMDGKSDSELSHQNDKHASTMSPWVSEALSRLTSSFWLSSVPVHCEWRGPRAHSVRTLKRPLLNVEVPKDRQPTLLSVIVVVSSPVSICVRCVHMQNIALESLSESGAVVLRYYFKTSPHSNIPIPQSRVQKPFLLVEIYRTS